MEFFGADVALKSMGLRSSSSRFTCGLVSYVTITAGSPVKGLTQTFPGTADLFIPKDLRPICFCFQELLHTVYNHLLEL